MPKKVIFIGIDYLCFSLSKSLLDNNKYAEQPIEIIAFIDDEPWNNRTQVHGVTVFSPSEISALVRKHDVTLIIQIQGESISIADNIWEGIFKTKAKLITLEQYQDIATMQKAVYQAYAIK
ncbi:nucleoside-diphosphate sugar epimerase/dehydratase [Marinomonas polaris]|uniref:nucleoside-diphosphate sugar epimerase/dehydratase n=1 Tax=Marinomonas polaris TaxID=293552 RepID=UPI003F9C79A5